VVLKVWDDAQNQDDICPENIFVQLTADGENYGDPVELNADNNWTYTWPELEKNSAGKAIVYAVDEVDVPFDYEKQVTHTEEGDVITYTITNTHITYKVNVVVLKVWDDSENQDGYRPESIFVQLTANGEAFGEPVELNDGNKWTYTWEQLEKNSAGKAIVYEVDEVEVPEKYEKNVTHTEEGDVITYTITNTHETEETEATVIKVWDDEENQDGIRPEKLTVELLVNGESFGLEVELNEDNGWTAKIDQLDKYMGGEEIEYKWTELDLPEGYELTDTSVEGKITTLTNTHVPGKVSVSVEKQWRDDDNRDGLRPQSITIQLTANGVNYGAPVVLNEGNNWKHTWAELDEKAGGKTILYEVEELDVPFGYGIIINGNPTDGYLIINPHDSEKIELEGVKIWVGETDEEHQRPASVTIRLYADGVEIDHAVCTAAGGWTFKFTDLYKYNNGKEIKYTITEDPVVGYSTSIEGMTVTNTWIPSPPTGDKGIVSYIAILFASLAVFVSAVVRRRKRRTV
jgi:hypothetical protein